VSVAKNAKNFKTRKQNAKQKEEKKRRKGGARTSLTYRLSRDAEEEKNGHKKDSEKLLPGEEGVGLPGTRSKGEENSRRIVQS